MQTGGAHNQSIVIRNQQGAMQNSAENNTSGVNQGCMQWLVYHQSLVAQKPQLPPTTPVGGFRQPN